MSQRSRMNMVGLQPRRQTHTWPRHDLDGRRLPLQPYDTLERFGDRLTSYERFEMRRYREIWYLGLAANKIEPEETSVRNGGFDDDKGYYKEVIHDHIRYRYEIVKKIGEGAYASVLQAFDHKTRKDVAIKILKSVPKADHYIRSEVEVLQFVCNEDMYDEYHVVKLLNHFTFRNHLCIVFELLGPSLSYYMAHMPGGQCSPEIIKEVGLCLMRCLTFLKTISVVHCDLKPENILMTTDDRSIKLIDFGTSQFAHGWTPAYIQSRFYRAPEVLLYIPFMCTVDYWSLGCILAEMYKGSPLFTSTTDIDHMRSIIEVLGLPPKEIISNSPRYSYYFTSDGNVRRGTTQEDQVLKPGSRPLSSILCCEDELFVDFIAKCLQWHPRQRYAIFMHKWLQNHHPPTGKMEKVFGTPLSTRKKNCIRTSIFKMWSTIHNRLC